MPLLAWNERLMTGIESMDSQHQQWIRLINTLHETLQQGKDSDIAYQTLNGMIDYTKTHFRDEEQLLFEYDCPDYLSHKKLHDDFIAELNNLQYQLLNHQHRDWLFTMKVIKLLSDWLANHIRFSDQKYAAFLKEKGVQ